MKKIEVYTDGSATIATKPGGWGYVLVIDGVKHQEGYGYMEAASNNDAELEAAIQGLVAAYKYSNQILDIYDGISTTLVSDSNIILGWANGSYRFKQAAKIQKYKQLKALVEKMGVKTRWVEGHTGDEHNERCDYLANVGRKQLIPDQKPERKPRGKAIKLDDSGIITLEFNGVTKVIDLNNNTVQDQVKD